MAQTVITAGVENGEWSSKESFLTSYLGWLRHLAAIYGHTPYSQHACFLYPSRRFLSRKVFPDCFLLLGGHIRTASGRLRTKTGRWADIAMEDRLCVYIIASFGRTLLIYYSLFFRFLLWMTGIDCRIGICSRWHCICVLFLFRILLPRRLMECFNLFLGFNLMPSPFGISGKHFLGGARI